jgi:hypothetical protein
MTGATAAGASFGRNQRFLLLGLAVLVTLFSAWRFNGPSRGYWDTYITVPAMFMTGQAVDLHRMDGSPRYDIRLQGRVPDDTYDPRPDGFGIASEDQRIGTAILFAAPFALVNMAAFRWGYAATWGLLFVFTFLGLRRLSGGFWIPLGGALLLVLNPFSLTLDTLNGNLFGLAILVFLFVLMTEDDPAWWLIGLVYGILGGIRNEAIVLAPLMVAFLWHDTQSPRRFVPAFAAFTAAAFVAILPVLLWNQFAYGQMIIHPSQVTHLEGFRPTFPHSLLGMDFQFNGLLNVPFHDHLVRTPHFAFPTFLLWPLVTILVLGVPLAALAVIGAFALARRRPFEARALLFWYLVVYALFMFQENWEELKQTFMALHLFPLAAFVAAGARSLADDWRQWRRWAVLGATCAALALGVHLAGRLDVPVDERWPVRFPHAARNDSGLAELPDERRLDWQFFYTRETPAEVERQRVRLTTPSLFPAPYLPFAAPRSGTLERIANEPFTRDLRTLAIWSYIYE